MDIESSKLKTGKLTKGLLAVTFAAAATTIAAFPDVSEGATLATFLVGSITAASGFADNYGHKSKITEGSLILAFTAAATAIAFPDVADPASLTANISLVTSFLSLLKDNLNFEPKFGGL